MVSKALGLGAIECVLGRLTQSEEDRIVLGSEAGGHERGDVQQSSRVDEKPKVAPVVERATNEPDDLDEKALQRSNPGDVGRGIRGEELVLIVRMENAE